MKYRFKSLLFLVISFAHCSAQYNFNKVWDRRFGGTDIDGFHAMDLTADGGFILAGSSISGIGGDKTVDNWGGAGNVDFWVVKVDAHGNKQWDKHYGSFSDDYFRVVKQTPDGGYVFAGENGGVASGDKSEAGRGSTDYWIIKTDSAGLKQWDKRFGGSGNDFLYALDCTADGGYILGGFSTSGIGGDKTQSNWGTESFYGDYWVVKIDAAGNKQWDKRFGGDNMEVMYSVLQTKDGGYLLGGQSNSQATGDKTQNNWDSVDYHHDYWVVKIDSSGFKEWDKRYGGIEGEELKSIVLTNDGNYLLAGNTYSMLSGDKSEAKAGLWLVKIDTAGLKIWDRTFDGSADLTNVIQTQDGGYAASGISTVIAAQGDKTEQSLGQPQSWIIKTDAAGNKQWDKTIFTKGGFDSEGYILQTADGCYVDAVNSKADTGGYKSQLAWNSSSDYWLLKFCMDTLTAITEISEQPQIQIYPNPFSSDVSIAIAKQNLRTANFTITNSIGQTVYKKEESNLSDTYTKMLDLSYLPNGLYFLEVVVESSLQGGKATAGGQGWERVTKELLKE